MTSPYHILKYYHYTPIETPDALRKAHHALAASLDLRGRIKIAPEGINATLSGTPEACKKFLTHLQEDPRFAGLKFNLSTSPHPVHEKLHVRLKPEIVHSGLHHIIPSPRVEERRYIDVETFHTLRKDPNVIVVDVRSHHEHSLGRFKGSITLNIETFREFPKKLAALPLDKSKTYVTTCTGGIKSEKARDFLIQEMKMPKVYQLDGGILEYGKRTDGEGFEGVCYVFDQRITVPINKKDPSLISHCHICQTPSARMVNCANPVCNRHMPLCEPCGEAKQGACSTSCLEAPTCRPYDGSGYYQKPVERT